MLLSESRTTKETAQERSGKCILLQLLRRADLAALQKIKCLLHFLITIDYHVWTAETSICSYPVLAPTFSCLNISKFSKIVIVQTLYCS